MKTRYAALAIVLVALIGCEMAAEAQQATIRPSPQAPVSPNPRSEAELNAFVAVQNEPNATDRLRLADSFLSDYFDSEFRHLIYRFQWQSRYELQRDPEEIIETALAGIEAQNHFLNSKLTFIDDPSRVADLPGVRYALKNQEALFYQSIVEAYDAMDDFDRVVEYGELALDAQNQALEQYEAIGEPGTPEYEQTVGQIQGGQLFVLLTLLEGYQQANEPEKVLEYGRAILDISPEDLNTLMLVSLIMSDSPPEDAAAAQAHWEETREYAQEAVRQLTLYLEGPDSAQLGEDQRSTFISEVNTTLGMANLQLEQWTEAAEAFSAAIAATPRDASLYYMHALALNGNRDLEGMMSALARAVYLDHPEPQVETALATIYENVNGSTEGLDDFIEGEGEQIED